MIKESVKVNQIWKSKVANTRLLICGVHGGKWKTKILGEKPGVYRGSHTVTTQLLQRKYNLETK